MLLITITSKSYCCPTFDPSSVIDGRKRAGGLSRDQPVLHTCFEADSVTMYSFYDVVDGKSLFSTLEPLRSGPIYS
jgi:hypothetical protein